MLPHVAQFADRLPTPDDTDFAIEFLREKRRAQIVTSHVRGQRDRAFGLAELVEPFFADELIIELGLDQFVNGGLADGPGIVVKRAKDPPVIERAWRTGPNDADVGQNSAAR